MTSLFFRQPPSLLYYLVKKKWSKSLNSKNLLTMNSQKLFKIESTLKNKVERSFFQVYKSNLLYNYNKKNTLRNRTQNEVFKFISQIKKLIRLLNIDLTKSEREYIDSLNTLNILKIRSIKRLPTPFNLIQREKCKFITEGCRIYRCKKTKALNFFDEFSNYELISSCDIFITSHRLVFLSTSGINFFAFKYKEISKMKNNGKFIVLHLNNGEQYHIVFATFTTFVFAHYMKIIFAKKRQFSHLRI